MWHGGLSKDICWRITSPYLVKFLNLRMVSCSHDFSTSIPLPVPITDPLCLDDSLCQVSSMQSDVASQKHHGPVQMNQNSAKYMQQLRQTQFNSRTVSLNVPILRLAVIRYPTVLFLPAMPPQPSLPNGIESSIPQGANHDTAGIKHENHARCKLKGPWKTNLG